MTLFRQMKQCNVLLEALTEEERTARAARNAAASVASNAIHNAIRKSGLRLNVTDVVRRRSSTGYITRFSIESRDQMREAYVNGLLRPIELALRRAGFPEVRVTASVSGKNTGSVRVVFTREDFAKQSSPMEEPQLEMVDVSKPITSVGSTKGMLPGHVAAERKKKIASIKADLGDLDVEPELDEFGDPIDPREIKK